MAGSAMDSPLKTLPVMTEAERQQLVVEWNQTEAEYPKDQCIHQLVEAQAQQTPDALALSDAARQLTYHELNERANHLAHQLQELGVGPEVLVGICAGHS